MRDSCTTCGKERRKRERWFYTYPDILPPGHLTPIAIYCKDCVPIGLAADRLARWHAAHPSKKRLP